MDHRWAPVTQLAGIDCPVRTPTKALSVFRQRVCGRGIEELMEEGR